MRQLEWLHEHDEKTGLLSQAGLMSALQTEMTGEAPTGDRLVVIAQLTNYLDIQNAFGAEFATDLLHRICARGREVLPDEHPMALIQPDRLAVLLEPRGSEALRDRLEARLREPYDVDGVLVYVDFSFGAASFPTHAGTAEELLQKASIAMHMAWKSQTPALLYDSSTDVSSRENLVLLGLVPAALVSDEFEIWHQAKIDLASGRVSATEALLRWRQPSRGLIPPDMFIPFVEESPLIDDLTHWVIAEALAHKAGWDAQGRSLGVAVNLSVRNLHDRSLVEVLLATVNEHGIRPEEVDLEVTESAVMYDFDHCAALVGRLRDHGFNVSIDDFGTGHSSLAYLKRLPVTSLKIDQAFVRNLATDPADQTIARTIVDLAASLGLRSIAEGVEDEGSAILLRDMGCDYAQGYFFHRPCPNVELVEWIDAGGPVVAGSGPVHPSA
jgi:predicted signal transduction protein with EAL and GGDEF domain